MAIIKNLFGIRDIKKPIFYKEFSEVNKQLIDLIELSDKVKSDKKEYIDRDITFLKAGLKGEENVYFELKNSFIPMICLHDIRIQEGDYVAQLDFVLITAQFIMILETKKLNGDIYINEYGDFIRSIKNRNGKVIKKEGIYSPIEQNNRHIRIVRDYLIKNKVIKNFAVISGVVIANPKSIVNRSKAPWNIKNEILKHDQLTNFINKKISSYKEKVEIFEDNMKEIANVLLRSNTQLNIDYYKKYSLTEVDFIDGIEEKKEEAVENIKQQEIKGDKAVETVKSIENIDTSERNYEDVFNNLKEVRLKKSKELKVKPYFIFNNETLDEIIKVNPKSKEELIKVKGFGPKKIEDYGEDIINIIKFE